jgi:tetratricopeptide (TPR) repeat protein
MKSAQSLVKEEFSYLNAGLESMISDVTETLPYKEQEARAKELALISDLSKKGYQFLKENRVEDAMDSFSGILGMDPNNNYALVGMGDAARKKGSYREAINYYRRCLSFHPGNNYALFGEADCYKALNQYNKAIEIWEQYLIHDKKNITVITRVADAYRKVRDFKHSKELYLRVLDIEKQNPYAIIGLGHLHYDFKEYKDALFYWEKMLETGMETVDIRVLTSIGNCHRKMRTFKNGIKYFEKALERDGANFYALFGMADCYRGMNLQEYSLNYWNKILDQDPRNKVILTRAGDAYRYLSNYNKAVEYYRRALNIEFDTYAVLGLATVAKKQGNIDEAVESLKSLIRQDPKNFRPYIELADCLYKKGDRRRAIETLEEFQKFGIRNQAITDFLEQIRS